MTDTAAFDRWAQSTQTAVEKALTDLLPAPDVIPNRLHEAMRYAVLNGGKRVRPLLVFATGALFDANEAVLSRAAAAVEMIHAYSLVHDDMPCMDNDVLRRGRPTVHVQYDEATALLAGDALQSQAFIVLSQLPCASGQVVAMIKLLAHASGSTGMCGGQAIDLASVGLSLSREQLEHMHQLKTGALLKASVMLGAYAGKLPSEKESAALESYAKAIGLAFQVVDDILDATADSGILGKTAGKDAEDNKPTYVSILGLEESIKLAENLREKACHALAPLGEKAKYLHHLADLIVHRNK